MTCYQPWSFRRKFYLTRSTIFNIELFQGTKGPILWQKNQIDTYNGVLIGVLSFSPVYLKSVIFSVLYVSSIILFDFENSLLRYFNFIIKVLIFDYILQQKKMWLKLLSIQYLEAIFCRLSKKFIYQIMHCLDMKLIDSSTGLTWLKMLLCY